MIPPLEDPDLHDAEHEMRDQHRRPPAARRQGQMLVVASSPARRHEATVRHPFATTDRSLAGIRKAPSGALREGVTKAVGHAIADSAAARTGAALLTHVMPAPRVELSRHEIVVPRLPPRLDGLRVLHLSDLHLHPGPQVAWQIPGLVAAVPHDLVCYTGDFIDSDDDLPRLARFLAQMPQAAPAYAVLGNHDYTPYGRGQGSNDVPRLRETLTEAGITTLTNEAQPLHEGGLYLAGVDDPATGRDDLDRALARVPAAACSLLLAHSPDIVLRLGPHRPSAILAGHTHGGQIRLPLVGALLTQSHIPRRLAMGLHAYQGVQLFVSRGVGYSGLDIRIGCPPEVALLTLRSPVTSRVHALPRSREYGESGARSAAVQHARECVS